jgi:hypothetical protein
VLTVKNIGVELYDRDESNIGERNCTHNRILLTASTRKMMINVALQEGEHGHINLEEQSMACNQRWRSIMLEYRFSERWAIEGCISCVKLDADDVLVQESRDVPPWQSDIDVWTLLGSSSCKPRKVSINWYEAVKTLLRISSVEDCSSVLVLGFVQGKKFTSAETCTNHDATDLNATSLIRQI